MRTIFSVYGFCVAFVALLFLVALNTKATADNTKQLWVVAPGDSIGWTFQNADARFQIRLATGIEQQAGFQNIAANRAVLRSDGLHRPSDMILTRIITYDAATAQASFIALLPNGSTTEESIVKGIANYCVNRGLLGSADSLTVFEVDHSTPEAGLRLVWGIRKEAQ